MEADSDSIVQAETRKLAAIMFTDMVGFSRQVGADEARALQLLNGHNAVIQQAVATYHGHILRFIGDAFLVEFPSVVNAVQCTRQIQARFQAHNADKAKDGQIHVRIGIHLGDIIQRDSDVFGDGANIAARMQELAEPDTICISQKVYEEVEKKIPLGTVISLGRPEEALGLAEKAVRLNPRLPLWDLVYLGHTYYLAGRAEEAIAALKKSLNGSPADLDTHLLLAAVYSEVGRDAEAQAEAAEVLRINPNWSLEVWKQGIPYKDPAMLERVFAALRKAGLK